MSEWCYLCIFFYFNFIYSSFVTADEIKKIMFYLFFPVMLFFVDLGRQKINFFLTHKDKIV